MRFLLSPTSLIVDELGQQLIHVSNRNSEENGQVLTDQTPNLMLKPLGPINRRKMTSILDLRGKLLGRGKHVGTSPRSTQPL